MQDTWLVTADGGVPLATLPMEIVRSMSDLADGARSQRGRRRPLLVGRGRPRRLPRLPRRRVGHAGHRRPAAVREALPRGLPVRAVLADDPAQARGFRRAFADFDPEVVAGYGDARGRAAARRRVDRASPRQDRGVDQQRPARCSSSSRREGSLAGVRLAVRARPDGASRRRSRTRGSATRHRPTRRARWRRISSGAAGRSSGRRRSTRSCRRWASSTTTSTAATRGAGSRRRATQPLLGASPSTIPA